MEMKKKQLKEYCRLMETGKYDHSEAERLSEIECETKIRMCAFCGNTFDISEFEITYDENKNKMFRHKVCKPTRQII